MKDQRIGCEAHATRTASAPITGIKGRTHAALDERTIDYALDRACAITQRRGFGDLSYALLHE